MVAEHIKSLGETTFGMSGIDVNMNRSTRSKMIRDNLSDEPRKRGPARKPDKNLSPEEAPVVRIEPIQVPAPVAVAVPVMAPSSIARPRVTSGELPRRSLETDEAESDTEPPQTDGRTVERDFGRRTQDRITAEYQNPELTIDELMAEARRRSMEGQTVRGTNVDVTYAKKPICKLKDFEGTVDEDAEEWLEHFQWVCQMNNWSEIEAIGRWSNAMVGKANSWFSSLLPQEKQNLETMKNLFKTDFAKAHGDYQKMMDLSNLKQRPAEGVNEFFNEIKAKCRRAERNMSDMEIKRHFITGLRPEIREHVMLMAGMEGSLEDALKLARRKEASMQLMEKEKAPTKAVRFMTETLEEKVHVIHEEGSKEDSKLDMILKKLEELERTCVRKEPAKNEIKQEEPYGPKRDLRICDYCNKQGHIAARCWHNKDRRRLDGSPYERRRGGPTRGFSRGGRYRGDGRGFKQEERDQRGAKKEEDGTVRKMNNSTTSTTTKFQHMTVEGTINGIPAYIICDTGTGLSLIGGEIFDLYWKDTTVYPMKLNIKTANGQNMPSRGMCDLKIEIGGVEQICVFNVVDDLAMDIIIGNESLKKFQADIDFPNEVIRLRGDKVAQMHIRKKNGKGEYNVRAMEAVEVPANHMIGILVDIEGENHYRSIETPLGIFRHRKIMVKPGIVSPGRKKEILLVNPFQFPITIEKDTIIARAEKDDSLAVLKICEKPYELDDNMGIVVKQIGELKFDDDILEEQQQAFREFLIRNATVFAVNNGQPGRALNTRHYIDTGDHPPISKKLRRFNPAETEQINKEINRMLKDKIIRKSVSPWCSPIVMVPKPDGSTRVCIDFREINKITKKDVFPLPRIDNMLDRLGGMQYYSTTDLACGFWAVEIYPPHQEKAAFICPMGLYEFIVMPFGMCNAPATFQRMMNEVLEDAGLKMGFDYIDDIIIGSKTFEGHMEELQKLFDALRRKNLTLKLSKCKFLRRKVAFLGHVVSGEGVSPNPNKIVAIEKMKEPINIKGLRRFLGMTSYYRRFIGDYARIAEPLNKLLQKGAIYRWNDNCQKAFDILKEKIKTAPLLVYPDFNRTFILQTDASLIGLGAVLCQLDDEGNERVIAYASRTISKHERNYTTTELECLAIVWATKVFKNYLYGRKFIVQTDHQALKWLFGMKEPSGRLARWIIKLQECDMEIQHRKGKIHSNADALSRIGEDGTIYLVKKYGDDFEDIRIRQEMDKDLGPIWRYLNKDEVAKDRKVMIEAGAYEMVDGILYRVLPSNIPGGPKNFFRIAIPDSLKPLILEQCHDNIQAEHLGVHKTYERIREMYYWKGMMKDVRQWISMCMNCAMKKGIPNKRIVLGSLETSEPLEILGADIIGPLPMTPSDNKYIITFTDHFTRWVEAVPLKTQKAREVAEAYIKAVGCRIGFPRKFLSDRGSNFIGEVMTEVHKIMETTQLKTSSYHPQSNGLTERFNQTIVGILTMYVSQHKTDWDELLPFAVHAYNTAWNATTTYTPFYLMFARNARMFDNGLPTTMEEMEKKVTREEYTDETIQRMKQVYEEVREINNKMVQKRIRESEKEAVMERYKEGDLVWLYGKVNQDTKKFHIPWKGPFRIEQVISQWNVLLRNVANNKMKKSPTHVSRIKRYVEPKRPSEIKLDLEEKIREDKRPEAMEDEEDDPIEDGDNYKVEKIVDHEVIDRKIQYKVRWKGYTPEYDSWLMEENMSCDDLIKNYNRRAKTRIAKHRCPKCGRDQKTKPRLKKHKKRCQK